MLFNKLDILLKACASNNGLRDFGTYQNCCMAEKFDRGKFDEFAESSVIYQTKLILTVNNLSADTFICQTFLTKCSQKNEFAKLSTHQTLPLHCNTH